jgi:hypothetical protein
MDIKSSAPKIGKNFPFDLSVYVFIHGMEATYLVDFAE